MPESGINAGGYRVQIVVGMILSVPLLLWPALRPEGAPWGMLEGVAVVSYAWSTWLLAWNRALGWWVGLLGCALYGVIFWQVKLYAEVGIMGVYFVTSLQAIWIWLRGGEKHAEKPVDTVPPWAALLTGVAVVLATLALWQGLKAIRGEAPFWDALTTCMSLAAHIWLMQRWKESWYIWIAVDIIYVPLYHSRGLLATTIMYACFLGLAAYGMVTFRRIWREQGVLDAGQPAAAES